MLVFDPQLTAGEVLRAFHHDEPFLFLGAAFNTVTIILLGLCIIRRKADGMLLSLAWFAHLYGLRLWMNSDLLNLSLPSSELFHRMGAALNYLVAIPAFIFFHFAGFLGKFGRYITPFFILLFSALIAATLTIGSRAIFFTINNAIIGVALIAVVIGTIRRTTRDRDSRVILGGLLAFAIPVIAENLLGIRQIEPYGFAVLLACLGYVAASRTLQRDREYSEIQQQLDLARSIQLSILPASFPASRSFRVAAKYVPMTSVAGDLYDFLVADDRHAGLLIADVSGHGVPAALIASMVKMAATSQRTNIADPALLLAGMNSALCGNTQGQYVTAAYAYLDADTGKLHYSAAGHPAMLLLRDDVVTEIAENGMLLAAVDSARYDSKMLPMHPGDRLLLYTDGLLEARNAEGKLFGEASLRAEFQNTAHLEPALAVDRLIDAVQRWAKSQDDDLTVLVCDFVGAA